MQDEHPSSPGTPSDIPASVADEKPRFAGGINRYPPHRSKVDDMLSDEHRVEYERLLARHVTIPKLLAWLHERGYRVGRCTVDRHRMKWSQRFTQVRHGAETIAEFARLARATGLTLEESTVGGLFQMIMQVFTQQVGENPPPVVAKDVQILGSAVDGFIDTRRKLEQVRREVENADKSGKKEVDTGAVVDRVREILGV